MKAIRAVSEDELVSVFLAAETLSSRFGDRIDKHCPPERRSWLSDPDLEDPKQNAFRHWLLGKTRGWKDAATTSAALGTMPDGAQWTLVEMQRAEVLAIKYFGDGLWITDTDGTRLATDLHEHGPVDSPLRSLGQVILPFWQSASPGPAMIAVAPEINGPYVMLEGNGRLTAFALSDVQQVQLIVGVHPNISSWLWW